MCFRTFTEDFDYNLRFLILDAPGPAGILRAGFLVALAKIPDFGPTVRRPAGRRPGAGVWGPQAPRKF